MINIKESVMTLSKEEIAGMYAIANKRSVDLEKENSELKARMSFALIILYDMAYHLECRDFYIKDWSDFIKIEEFLKWERE